MNSVNIVGRLTKDLELQKTQSGLSVCSFNVACDRWTNGEKKADFIYCKAWGKVAEAICTYGKKGSQVAISGDIQNDNYEKADGTKVYGSHVNAVKVRILDKKEIQPSLDNAKNDLELDENEFDF